MSGQPVTYTYQAARANGAIERGVVDAETREAASEKLSRQGLFPIQLRAEARASTARVALSARDLALGLRLLATLVEAGLPMGRALAALDELAPAKWRPALPAVRDAVRDGASLGAALAQAPIAIPPVVVGIIQAGEAGSGLGPAIRRAAELSESAATTREAIRGALAYPMVLAVAGTASVALLVGVVLPRFGAILADLGQALPPTTQFVLSAAFLARSAALPTLGAAVLLGLFWRAWMHTPEGRVQWNEYLLALPAIGSVRFAVATERGCTALAALLESGVPIAAALARAARATGDAGVERRLLLARDGVVVGERLASAVSRTGAVTPTAVRLIRAGEETGRLAAMLTHAATLERQRAEQSVRAAVRLVEPALILVFAGIVAVVAAALLQAIYSVRPTP